MAKLPRIFSEGFSNGTSVLLSAFNILLFDRNHLGFAPRFSW